MSSLGWFVMLSSFFDQAGADKPVGMQPLGWLFMLTSTISVTVLTLWCFARVLTSAEEKGGDKQG